MKLAALALACCLFAPAPVQKAQNLPRAEADKLRAALTEALEKQDEPSRTALLRLGAKLEAKYAYESLRDALRDGPKLDTKSAAPRKQGKHAEELKEFGTTTSGYEFTCEAGTFRYAVDLPKGYDPQKPAPVLLDPGHGTGKGKSDEEKAGFVPFYRAQCEAADLDSWIVVRTEILEQVGADGLRGALPEERIAAVFQELWRDLASRFAIDVDRLYAAGLSQTGFWAWYLGRASADRYAGLAPMSSVTWQVNRYLDNYRNVPVFVIHGDQDPICKVEQPRATVPKLEQLGFAVKYLEIAGGGHDPAVFGRLHEGLAWLAPKPRAKYARTVSKSFLTLADPWCGFVRVLELDQEGDGKATSGPTAGLDAAIEGQTVRIRSKGVKRIEVCLARELLDLAQPVEVVWNDKSVQKGKLATKFATTLELALERVDWAQTFECAIPLRAP